MKAHLLPWLIPLDEEAEPDQDAGASEIRNWPRVGGVLDILLGVHEDEKFTSTNDDKSTQQSPSEKPAGAHSQHLEGQEPRDGTPGGQSSNAHSAASQIIVPIMEEPENAVSDDKNTSSATSSSQEATDSSGTSQQIGSLENTTKLQAVASKHPSRIQHEQSSPATDSKRPKLKLEILELERITLSIPVLMKALDWRQLTSLTILR
jgi:hypothetical protein